MNQWQFVLNLDTNKIIHVNAHFTKTYAFSRLHATLLSFNQFNVCTDDKIFLFLYSNCCQFVATVLDSEMESDFEDVVLMLCGCNLCRCLAISSDNVGRLLFDFDFVYFKLLTKLYGVKAFAIKLKHEAVHEDH